MKWYWYPIDLENLITKLPMKQLPRRLSTTLLIAVILSNCLLARNPLPVLEHADVVTMYQGDADTYEAYGIDVIAWGGTPTPEALEAAGNRRFVGSVGMVTEWSRYHRFAGKAWKEGIARDYEGNPIQPPWLLDMAYEGIPLYWCCTNQQLFRDYILYRVRQTIEAGAAGLHIDDHLGSAATVYHGGCFCDACRERFPEYLQSLDEQTLQELGQPAEEDLPYSLLWNAFQLHSVRDFMREIREFAGSLRGHPVPMSANSYLSHHPHSTDYDLLDYFSSEVPQSAASEQLSDLPLVAYRLAEALGRPIAATASGEDWAHVKAGGADRLVRNWIAQAYAAGQFFMTPHRQWCHTTELGTHWYDGPETVFAPLYRWIRSNSGLFNDHDTLADVVVLFDMRLYRSGNSLQELSSELSAAGINYQFAIMGDPILPITPDHNQIAGARALLIPKGTRLDPATSALLDTLRQAGRPVHDSLESAIDRIHPLAVISDPGQQERYRCFVRQSDRGIIIHLINRLPVGSIPDETLQLDISSLVLPDTAAVRMTSYPGTSNDALALSDGCVSLQAPMLWAMVEIIPE